MTIMHPARAAAPRAWSPSLGAWPVGDGIRFRVWAPKASVIEVVIERPGGEPLVAPLGREPDGNFAGLVPEARVGDRYRYRVDGRGPFPDPASRFQPEGVHGPSEVVEIGRFAWSDAAWGGLTPEDLVIYELHVGTFSPEGTFDGVRPRLGALKELGVTAIELMPLADFDGERNWGYDGVHLFAPTRAYGTPDDLRRLVDEAHRLGLGVILDVVYNHLGPAGNYTSEFSDLYTSTSEGCWGSCMNLDGEGSEHVNALFHENALYWLGEFHFDGLRLDATHALRDETPPHFLEVLSRRVRAAFPDRWVPLIAEDHRNLNLMLRPHEEQGWGLDGVWADDFHHEVRRLLAGDDEAYYSDFAGTTADIATTINQGWFFTGQRSEFLGEDRGTDPAGLRPRQFVVCLQNHDQVGNRAMGERLHHQIDVAAYRAASALLLCVPQTPLLFMGQEWACSAPFRFFTDFDEELGRLVTEGRRKEFRHFRAFADPSVRETIPDPQDPATFDASRLDWDEREAEPHASVLRLYRALLHLRTSDPALLSADPGSFHAVAIDEDSIGLRREGPDGEVLLVAVRLRGSGEVDLGRHPELVGSSAASWEVALTTEDQPFAPDPSPPRIEASDGALVIHFGRPSAVLLRAARGSVAR